jgi:indole-3-glycerol phosphate synthase
MEALVEVHREAELDVALEHGVRLVGVNNRDLETLEVDLGVTERLVSKIPSGVLAVSASGIRNRDEMRSLEILGIRAFLIGEALATASDPERKLREFVA